LRGCVRLCPAPRGSAASAGMGTARPCDHSHPSPLASHRSLPTSRKPEFPFLVDTESRTDRILVLSIRPRGTNKFAAEATHLSIAMPGNIRAGTNARLARDRIHTPTRIAKLVSPFRNAKLVSQPALRSTSLENTFTRHIYTTYFDPQNRRDLERIFPNCLPTRIRSTR